MAYQPIREIVSQAMSDPGAAGLVQRSLYLRRLVSEESFEQPSASNVELLQTELFSEVRQLLATLSTGRPVLICLDDLHAADEGSLQLIRFVARQLSDQPVLLLAATRLEDSNARSEFVQLRSSLRREARFSEIELTALSSDAIARIVGQSLGEGVVAGDLAAEIAERAGGNPLFAGELVRTLRDEGRLWLSDGQWRRRGEGEAPVPAAVRDLLALRLQRLSEAAREELNVVAVAGPEIDFRVLREASGLPDRTALDALDECLSAFILEESAGGYRFRHTMLREAAYAALTRARREHIHRLIAEALAAGQGTAPAGADTTGHHFALSDEPWRAVPYFRESGRQAAGVFSNQQALDIFERALLIARSYPADASTAEMALLLEDLGDLRRRMGDAAGSVPLFEEASQLLGSAEMPEAAMRTLGKAALGRIVIGDVAVAAEMLSGTLDAVESEFSDDAISRTYYLLSQLHWHSGEHEEALKAAEQALAAAEMSGEEESKARAYEVMALACHSLGDWQRGVEYEMSRHAMGRSGFDTDEAFDAHL